MPTKPKVQTLAASSMDILNAIRNNASYTYQQRVPVATQNNIREVGGAIMQFEGNQNEFLSALVNRIARVIVTSKMYENPLRMFKQGIMEFGETVEEVFVNIAKAHQFDPAVAETEVFKREIPDVDAVFHKMNLQNFYKATVSVDQLRMAFLSMDGVTDLVARIVDSLYSGANYDEFLTMKHLLVESIQGGKLFPIQVAGVDTKTNAESTTITIKGISNVLPFGSTKYNPMGVLTYTNKEDQFLIMDAKASAAFDVSVLAAAFNMDKVEFMGHVVMIDDFENLTGVVAALVDRNWFMVFDNMLQFTENYNGQGLYWNYFWHVWKTFSTSPFQNAIVFTTNNITATGVTVNPATATVTPGQQVQLGAQVTGGYYMPQDVTWSIRSGDTTPKPVLSSVNPFGLVSIANGEQNEKLIVTATSVYAPTVSGNATLTIS